MTDNPQSVIRAGPEHAARLIISATYILLEEALQPISEARVTGLVERCVNHDGAIAGIILGGNGIEASVGLSVERLDYSEEPYLRVQWLGVHEGYRQTDHHSRLLEFCMWAADTLGLPLISWLLTKEDLQGKFHAVIRRIPQVGAVFAWGAVLDGRYAQKFVGDDPYHKLKRRQPVGTSAARAAV